jgi:hypothetical protein
MVKEEEFPQTGDAAIKFRHFFSVIANYIRVKAIFPTCCYKKTGEEIMLRIFDTHPEFFWVDSIKLYGVNLLFLAI